MTARPELRRCGLLNRRTIAFAAIIMLAALLFGRALPYDWVWDDSTVRLNPIFQGPLLDGVWATQHDHLQINLKEMKGIRAGHDSWRPLMYLSYRLDVALAGMSAPAMRLHNLLLALLAVLLLYRLARIWLEDERAALAAAVLFALHPVHIEPII